MKWHGTAFTLMVASHCVVATREVDQRRSTRDLRPALPSKNLCASALNKLPLFQCVFQNWCMIKTSQVIGVVV